MWLTPLGARDFSLFQSAKTGSGAHPASNLIVTGGSLPRGRETRANIRTVACTVLRLRTRGAVLPPQSSVLKQTLVKPYFLRRLGLTNFLPAV